MGLLYSYTNFMLFYPVKAVGRLSYVSVFLGVRSAIYFIVTVRQKDKGIRRLVDNTVR